MKLKPHNPRLTTLIVASLGFMMAVMTPDVQADLWVTPSNAQDTAKDPVDAQATFSISNGQITITIQNLQEMKDAGQLVSDLSFTVGSGSLVSATLSSSSGQEITVNPDGSTSLGSIASTGWGYTAPSIASGSFHLDDLNNGDSPAHTILGPSSGSSYSSANSSITGGSKKPSPHSPFLNGMATFTITGSGITAGTTIESVTFSFGTTSGDNVDGQLTSATPEPSTLALVGLGGFGFICYGFRRRVKNNSTASA